MKQKREKPRKNNLLSTLCALVSLCVYGYDWM